MTTINLEELKRLAPDPNLSTKAAFEKLGFNNYATFDYQLKKDPEAARIWKEGRDVASGLRAENGSPSTNGHRPKQTADNGRQRRSSKKAATPPAMEMPKEESTKSYSGNLFSSLTTSTFTEP